MLDIDHDRRTDPRISLTRPCKVFEARSRKYVAGMTCNVSTDGMLVRLSRPLGAEPGDLVYVAVARRRQCGLMRSADMLEARVVRSVGIGGGESVVAVVFTDAGQETSLPVRRAA
jgi:hypothetical protein